MQHTVVSPAVVTLPDSVGADGGQVPLGAGAYVPHWEVAMSAVGTPQPLTDE